jgi:hypothetical protein
VVNLGCDPKSRNQSYMPKSQNKKKKKERCGHSGLLFVYKAGGWAGPFVLDVDRPGVEAEFAFNTKPKQ